MSVNVGQAQANVLISAQTSGEQEITKLQQRIRELQSAAANFNGVQRAGEVSDRQRQFAMRDLGMQVGDLGVQLQTGTSFARAFAMQSGQMAGALAMFGGRLGAVGSFLTGPFGAALLLGVTTALMFADSLSKAEDGAKKLELATGGLGDAQGALGDMFDLSTGKIKDNTDAVRLNTLAKIANMRLEAQQRRAAGEQALANAGELNWDAFIKNGLRGVGMLYNRGPDADFSKLAKPNPEIARMLQAARDPKQAATIFRQALDKDFGKRIDFSKTNITLEEFRQGIIDTASGVMGDKAADDALAAVDAGSVPVAMRRTRTTRTRTAKKADPFKDAMTQFGGDREQMEFQLQALDKYGEKAASAKKVLVEWNIERGKYGKLTNEQKSALIAEAQATDDLAEALRKKTKAAKESKETDKDVAGWKAEVEAIADEANALVMTTLQYRQYVEARKVEAEIAQKRLDMEPAEFARWETERRAALAAKQAQESYNDALSKTAGQGTQQALKSYGEQIADVGKSAFDAWTKGLRATEDALVNFVMTGKLSFRELANSIIADIVRIAIQQTIMKGVTKLFGGLFADGGAFVGGVQKFAVGGVVSRPTLFPMANGNVGMMGEAGPEAIMPLRRLGNGRLGVEAHGGGTNNVTVNVNVDGGGSVATQGDPGKAAELGKAIAQAVRAELVQQKRPGGLLAA